MGGRDVLAPLRSAETLRRGPGVSLRSTPG